MDKINIAAPKQPQLNILKSGAPSTTPTKPQEECIPAKPETPTAVPKSPEVTAPKPKEEAPVQAPISKSKDVQLECTLKPSEEAAQITPQPEKPKEAPAQVPQKQLPVCPTPQPEKPKEVPAQVPQKQLPVCPTPQHEKPKEEPVQIPQKQLPVCPTPQPEKPKEAPVQLPEKQLPVCPAPQPEKPKEAPVQLPEKQLPVCPAPQPEKPKEAPVQLPVCPTPTKENGPSKIPPPIVGPPKIIDCEDWFPKDCCWWGVTVLPKSFWINEDLSEGRDYIAIGNNNNYLSSDKEGNLSIAKTAGKSELWRVIHKGERMINLLSYYGGFLMIHENGNADAKSRVACDDAQIHVLHSFNQCELDEINYAAFRAINGLYLSLSNNKVSGVKEVKDTTEIFKGHLWDANSSKCLQPLPAPAPAPAPQPIPIPAPETQPSIIPPPSTDETAPLPIPEEPISPLNVDEDEEEVVAIPSVPETVNKNGKSYTLECKVSPSSESELNKLGQGAKKDVDKKLKSHLRN